VIWHLPLLALKVVLLVLLVGVGGLVPVTLGVAGAVGYQAAKRGKARQRARRHWARESLP
jgi:hypothetical protein